MNQSLEPRAVKPNAPLKWARQALDLIARGFFAWFVLMAVFCLEIYLCRASMVAVQVFAGTAFLIGIEVAALVDDVEHRSVWQMFVFASEQFERVLSYVIKLVMMVTVMTLLVYVLMGHPAQWLDRWFDASLLKEANQEDLFTFTSELFAKSLTSLALFFVTVMTPIVSAPFHYHLMSFFDLDWWMANRAGNGGSPAKNFGAMLIMQLLCFAVPLLCAWCVPILAPIVYAFLSAFSYVAFRDIYLGIGENRKVSLVEVRRSASAVASSI